MANPKFFAKENSPFGDSEAELVARAANEIIKDRSFTREALVDYSRSPKSATHALFEWNDKIAAEAHRLERAGQLIGCVYQMNVSTKKPVRSYHSVVQVTKGGEALRSYRPVGEVIANEALLSQVSIDIYRAIAASCDRAEALGLDKDPAWRRIISTVRSCVPIAGT